MKKILLPLLVLVLVLSSCVSTTLVRPTWVDFPPKVVGSVVFVGYGEGSSEAEARSAAYRDGLMQMGNELGYEIYDIYYRELSSTRGIADFSTSVVEDFRYSVESSWFYYILLETPETNFYSARSPEYLERVSRESRIRNLLEEAFQAYKDNRDLTAAEKTLEAVLVSLEGDVTNEEYEPEALVEKAASYASLIRIDARKNSRKANPDDMTFRLVRNKGFLFKPPVEDAVVSCTFRSINLDGDVVDITQRAKSDSTGRFVFNRTSPYALWTGELVVRLYIDSDLLYRIRLKGGDELLAPIEKVLDEGALSHSYEYSYTEDHGRMLLALASYSYDGSLRDAEPFMDLASRFFSTMCIDEPDMVRAEGEEEDDAIEYIMENHDGYDTVYLCRIGVVDKTQVGDKWYSRTEGQIVVIDCLTGEKNVLVNMHYATGGYSSDEADDNALRGQAQIILGRILSVL